MWNLTFVFPTLLLDSSPTLSSASLDCWMHAYASEYQGVSTGVSFSY